MDRWPIPGYDALEAARRFLQEHPPFDELRERILVKRGHRCEHCGAEAATIHHILPRRLFPEFILEEWNCMVLCDSCHPRLESISRRIKR